MNLFRLIMIRLRILVQGSLGPKFAHPESIFTLIWEITLQGKVFGVISRLACLGLPCLKTGQLFMRLLVITFL